MVKKSEIFGFCLFDFANSAYTTVIITAVYGAYFAQKIGTPVLWSITLSASYLLTLLLSPVAGAMADHSAGRKRFLFFSYALCVLFTALLYFGEPGKPLLAAFLVVFSNLGFSLSEVFVSSFLPGISTRQNIGRISGYAWSFGYVGGIASLLASLIFLKAHGFSDAGMRQNCLLVAGFFGLFALPVFFLLKDRTEALPLPAGRTLLSMGFGRVLSTFREVRQYAMLFRFLTAFFFYSCGTAVVISFAAIFAQSELGFHMGDVIKLIFLSNITAAAGALIFGVVQDRIGAKQTLIATLVLWIVAVLMAFFSHGRLLFWLAANLVGFAMGASQSASRSLVGLLSPPGRSAEFYGFWGLAGKAASIAGLLVFGLSLRLFQGMRLPILVTALFFIVGLILLRPVDDGHRTVRDEFKDILGG